MDSISIWLYEEVTRHPERYEYQDDNGNTDYDLDKLAEAASCSPLAPELSHAALRRLADQVVTDAWEAGDL